MSDAVFEGITRPERTWSRAEVLASPSPAPASPGVYGWYFRELPCGIDASNCVPHGGCSLLYVGISPHAPAAGGGAPGTETIRRRIRTHYRGNASRSTLRLSLGVLLGFRLQRRSPTSQRLTFGDAETALDEWMSENAFVTWVATPAPWLAELDLIQRLNLPLNLQGNRAHPFWPTLSSMRRDAKALARLS